MKIEIASNEYWKLLNYYDGLLYCSMIEIDDKNDWRMVNDANEWYMIDGKRSIIGSGLWYIRDKEIFAECSLVGNMFLVIPVRDII